MTYGHIKLGLIVALTAAFVFTFSSGFSVLGLVVTAVLLLTLSYVVYAYRGHFARIYEERELQDSRTKPDLPYEIAIRGPRPRRRDMAPAFIFCGPVFVFMGYFVIADTYRPDLFMARFVFDAVGSTTISALFCLIGIVGTVTGVEEVVGRRAAQGDATAGHSSSK